MFRTYPNSASETLKGEENGSTNEEFFGLAFKVSSMPNVLSTGLRCSWGFIAIHKEHHHG
jgi:hypothetical protein